jgi:uncharacterized coiled-coil protein SlyX
MARGSKTVEMTSEDGRPQALLEEKIAFLEVTVDALHVALVDKENSITQLERRVEALEHALRRLAVKVPDASEVLGAMPEDDPVPRSG